jgi:hypothetical protein
MKKFIDNLSMIFALSLIISGIMLTIWELIIVPELRTLIGILLASMVGLYLFFNGVAKLIEIQLEKLLTDENPDEHK